MRMVAGTGRIHEVHWTTVWPRPSGPPPTSFLFFLECSSVTAGEGTPSTETIVECVRWVVEK